MTLDELALRPLDLLELLKPEDVQAMSELDDRILRYVIATATPRPDAALEIQYRSAPAGKISVFAAAALAQSLRTLIHGARPLRATDVMPPSEAAPEHDDAVFAERARVAEPLAELETLARRSRGRSWPRCSRWSPTPPQTARRFVAGVDGYLDEAVVPARSAPRASGCRKRAGDSLTNGGARRSRDLLAGLAALVAGWQKRLAEFDAKVAAYDALPPAPPKMRRASPRCRQPRRSSRSSSNRCRANRRPCARR